MAGRGGGRGLRNPTWRYQEISAVEGRKNTATERGRRPTRHTRGGRGGRVSCRDDALQAKDIHHLAPGHHKCNTDTQIEWGGSPCLLDATPSAKLSVSEVRGSSPTVVGRRGAKLRAFGGRGCWGAHWTMLTSFSTCGPSRPEFPACSPPCPGPPRPGPSWSLGGGGERSDVSGYSQC